MKAHDIVIGTLTLSLTAVIGFSASRVVKEGLGAAGPAAAEQDLARGCEIRKGRYTPGIYLTQRAETTRYATHHIRTAFWARFGRVA